jgi:hypothetical protein
MAPYPNLERVGCPADVRALDRRELGALASELRAFLIESVSKTGGHLSSNLGTVELTIALHHVFNTPHDRIVWDVGHQTYGHKVLTGRREAMTGLRTSAASPASRGAARANTTPSAPHTPPPRSRLRSAWPWRRAHAARTATRSR